MTNTAAVQTIGTRPVGTARGTELWATLTEDDGTILVTAYKGWGIVDEVRLSGRVAVTLAESVARQILDAHLPANVVRLHDGSLVTIPED